jgi:hypothetical protein
MKGKKRGEGKKEQRIKSGRKDGKRKTQRKEERRYREVKGKGKAIPVAGHEGPYGCETSRLPHFLDNGLTDGGEVVSPTRRPPFIPRKIPSTHFC